MNNSPKKFIAPRSIVRPEITTTNTSLWVALQSRLDELSQEREQVRGALQMAVRQNQAGHQALVRREKRIKYDQNLLTTLVEQAECRRQSYCFPSWTLAEAFDYCTADEEENMCLIAGFDIGGTRVGSHVLPLQCTTRTLISASANEQAMARSVFEIAASGMKIAALIHSHPGAGPEANHPSGTDLHTQAVWENADSTMIGAIFSRDAHLRFYACDRPLHVTIVGHGVQRLEPNHFKFDLASDESTEGLE